MKRFSNLVAGNMWIEGKAQMWKLLLKTSPVYLNILHFDNFTNFFHLAEKIIFYT